MCLSCLSFQITQSNSAMTEVYIVRVVPYLQVRLLAFKYMQSEGDKIYFADLVTCVQHRSKQELKIYELLV